MKTRSMWLILVTLLIVFAVAACGTDAPDATPAEEAVEEVVEEAVEAVEEVEEAAEEVVEEAVEEAEEAVEVVEEAAEEVVEEAAGEPEVVSVWFHSGQGGEREALDAAIEAFNSGQSAYVAEAVQLPEGSYTDQVNAAALAGDLPCLLDFDGPLLYNFAWSGYMQPIDEFVSDELKADFLTSIIDQGTYNGQLYSLGQFDSGLAMYGNKAYLDAAGVRIPTLDDPWSLDEFEAALEALTALDEVEYALDMKINYGRGEWYTYGFSPIIQSAGGGLIDRADYLSATGTLDGAASVDAMTHFQSWFANGWANPAPAGDDDFYGAKTAALSWVGHWMYNTHAEALGDDLVLLPLPDFGNGVATGMGSWNWGITSSCANPAGAWAVLEHLVSTEEVARMSAASGAVPALKSVLAESELFGPEGPLNLYVQQLDSGVAVPRPITPAYATITSAFAEAVDNIIAGGDVQEELSKAAGTIDLDIEDNQGYPVN